MPIYDNQSYQNYVFADENHNVLMEFDADVSPVEQPTQMPPNVTVVANERIEKTVRLGCKYLHHPLAMQTILSTNY